MTAMQHAASREAFAAAETRLSQVTSDASGDTLGTLADELFAVVSLLGKEPALRRTVADPATDPAAREQLVRQLLGGKVAAETMNVLSAVVTARWSSPRELVDGIETLGRTALLTQAERAERLDAVEDELFRLGRIVAADGQLDRLLSDATGNVEGKRALLRGLLGSKVEKVTLALVEQLATSLRGRGVVTGLEELADAAAKRRERSVAHVRTAFELTEAQQDRLTATLTRIYSRPIALHVELDPSVSGGLVIKIGDEVIDGSAAGRLEALRRTLAG
ncbi:MULTISPECIES: F0F1 ATP synthase subunit delta [unclassified Crossiella]|uniref:F0F1 ATP synthase subunit delta n=1 Tax=unclassified Crossiella TaxID=2620835 RepID=UPI0020004ED2|nr:MULTISPECIES: F0F1 ATP synthase subunit delta [unclassified Crossiella]MCK2244921.1 F0F1 ATP synthase subunit delta [Crossiella sp. S99.2]MCK2258526.1 F0F1 ATP synthase subunit delta [Crossiella sp. S99.1]